MSKAEAEWYTLVLGRLLRRPSLTLTGNVPTLILLYSRAVREKCRHMDGG